jgi:Rod binding domain-containing protein
MIDISSMLNNLEYKSRSADIAGNEAANINSREDLKQVAKEMESLFAFQLIKTMRETANNMSSNKSGLGYNTYMTLFDMEISRLMADRGLGLEDAIMNSIDKMEKAATENNEKN